MSLISFSQAVKWFNSFLSNTISQLNVKTELFQTIKFSISTQLFVYTQLNAQTVLFQTIEFSMSTQFKCQTVLFDP